VMPTFAPTVVPLTIWTIGHSTRLLPEFLGFPEFLDVGQIAQPASRKFRCNQVILGKKIVM